MFNLWIIRLINFNEFFSSAFILYNKFPSANTVNFNKLLKSYSLISPDVSKLSKMNLSILILSELKLNSAFFLL